MLLLLKTTQLWLNIYENYFLMPEMFKLSVVILGILQFRNFLSKWCQIFLMFESLGNFLGGSIVLQLEPTQKLFSRKLYNPYTVFYHTFFDLKLVYEVGPESFLPPPTVKSALLNIKRKHLFFDFKFKAKYLAFISCLLEKPDLSVKTALKSIFRKSQVRSISEKFGLNLNAQIVCLSPSQWLNCFLEMLEVVPEKFHPS